MRTSWNKGKTKKDFPQLSYSGVKKGNIPWNKGLKTGLVPKSAFKNGHKFTEAELRKKSESMKGKQNALGLKHSLETRRKISEAHKGSKSYQWKGGLPDCLDCGKKVSTRKGEGRCIKCYIRFAKETGIYRQLAINSMKKRGMSKLEGRVLSIIKKNKLPFKYVGDGAFRIGHKIPDFIGTKGKKIAVEVYYEDHKEKFRGGLQRWKEERERLFKELGWDILFIPQYMTDEIAVLNLLRGGTQH